MNAGLPPDIVDSALARGLSRSEVERQWARLHLPSRPCVPEAPCALGSGILRLDPARRTELEERGRRLQAIRFIPASGAATRMFKSLLARMCMLILNRRLTNNANTSDAIMATTSASTSRGK